VTFCTNSSRRISGGTVGNVLNAFGGRVVMPQPDPEKHDPNWGRYAGYGLQIALGVGLGLIVGRWLDKRYGWDPWGVLVGTMLGMAAGMYLLIKDAIRMNKD
jgi:F0F1-type ATP synthase assembly protein I